jgi:hypothetical protein
VYMRHGACDSMSDSMQHVLATLVQALCPSRLCAFTSQGAGSSLQVAGIMHTVTVCVHHQPYSQPACCCQQLRIGIARACSLAGSSSIR